VAIFRPDEPASALERSFGEGLIHGVALAPRVEGILRTAGATVGQVSLLCVGLGPGSYTGVRVGVSFAKSLAFAAGTPVVGVGSFPALAAGAGAAPGETVIAARDARRGSVYLAAYRAGEAGPEEILPLAVVPLEALPRALPEAGVVVGDALDRFPELLSGDRRIPKERERWEVSALALARLGERAFREEGGVDPHDLAPVYLRLSEAEERFGIAGGGP
jgi:tRNA threonylcarbamoyladenosine biosynthesis protein TsaB